MAINKIQNNVDALPLSASGEWGWFRGVNGEIQYNFTGLASGTKFVTSSGMVPISVTGSAVTLGPTHVGRTTVLNRAAGIAVTLPLATGSGNRYKIVVGTTFTGAATVKVAANTDYMIGVALLNADGGATTVGFATANTGTVATEDDTIDMLGTANSTGGFKGEIIELEDIASAIWSVRVHSEAGGTEATPFSATV